MKTMVTERLQFKRLVRVRELIVILREQLPESAGIFIANLKAGVDQLGVLVGAQRSLNGKRKQLETAKRNGRATLRADLAAINRAAVAVAISKPGFDLKFEMPANGDQQLLAAARSFAADAAVVCQDLQYAFPPGFIDNLKSNTEAFEKAVVASGETLRQLHEGDSAIAKVMQEAMTATVYLDAIFRNTFRDDPEKIAAWTEACLMQHSKRGKAAPPAPPPPETAATAAA